MLWNYLICRHELINSVHCIKQGGEHGLALGWQLCFSKEMSPKYQINFLIKLSHLSLDKEYMW